MYYGAKNNKSIGYSKNIVCNQDQESIISEATLNYVEKICSAKTLKNTKEIYKNKVSHKLIRKYRIITRI